MGLWGDTRRQLRRDSGDPTADRRADYAEMLFGSGEMGPAAEVLLGALELAPSWALGWFRLGEMREAAGAIVEAIEAWRMALALDPLDHAGATLKLALAGEGAPITAPPSAFVEALFDQYAGNFDTSLVDTLAYRVPQLVIAALDKAGITHAARAVDLGCGTGLMGVALRPRVDSLVGYDIAAAMLAKAKARGIYDRLEHADLQHLRLEAASADLVVAADVFMYVGALDGLLAMVAQALAPGGIFVFSVEAATDTAGFVLQPSRRYAHGQDYVADVVTAAGLHMVSIARDVIRTDRNMPIEGLIVVARAPI
jgi:predicted TPR repeat methyltransferase